jgi:multimeric flavodoxin WrbA
MTTKIVGISASLRNARSGEGAKELVDDLERIMGTESLKAYLSSQGAIHLDHYMKSGREKRVPYDQLYKEMRRLSAHSGLSNSEICLAAALWGAKSLGAEIEMVPLVDYFLPDGRDQNLDEFREKLRGADGLVVATPVYFGDRSSLSQRFIEEISKDPVLLEDLRGKVYGGGTVGAKRNGGQETTLIYQLHDMMSLGLVGVGNDYVTTSQYGGTGWAGDINTMVKDDSGLESCMGTGRRVATVASYITASREYRLLQKLRVSIVVLQDREREFSDVLKPFLDAIASRVQLSWFHLEEEQILPCMACDICPHSVGPDEVYRCIRGNNDRMADMHNQLLESDVIIPVVFSPKDRGGVSSSYQQFLERTRYLRRGDYALAEKLVAPIVGSEVGANDNINLRMCSSLIRHHTVLQKPMSVWSHGNELLNPEELSSGLETAVETGEKLLAGRLPLVAAGQPVALYKPIGYVLAVVKGKADDNISKREKAIGLRVKKLSSESRKRVARINGN